MAIMGSFRLPGDENTDINRTAVDLQGPLWLLSIAGSDRLLEATTCIKGCAGAPVDAKGLQRIRQLENQVEAFV